MSVQSGSTPPPGGNTPQQPETAMAAAFAKTTQGNQSQNASNNQQDQSAGQQQARPSSIRGGGVLDFNSRHRRPISRNQTGELTNAFSAAFAEHIDLSMQQAFRDNYSIHILDNASNMLPLSAILVCFAVNHNNAAYVGVYQLIVEGSGSKLSNRFMPINGQQVEIDVVAGDVVDGSQWERIKAFLADAYPGQKVTYLNAGSMVLPTELAADDKAHIHRVIFDATQALYTVMENDVTGLETALTIKDINTGNNLSAVLDYQPPALDNDVGLPVRSDLSVILRATLNTAQNQQIGGYQHEQVRELTRVDAYLDLVYNEPAPQAWNAPPITQRYFPRVVITDLNTEVDAVTPELMLLALSTATLLSKNMAWGGAYRPRYGQNPDLRDIGAIGYEVNLTGDPNAKPDRVDTKAESFGTPSLVGLLQQTVHDALIYSMDIDEVGPLAWLHQGFIAAANNDQGAYRGIIEAANRLTNEHFAQFWSGGAICVDDNNRVHLGYYTDTNGNRRDIRDIDYLALLNLIGNQDMGTVVSWSKTFDDVSVPLEVRLEQRAKLLKALLPGLQIKGYARRVTFTPDFITALNGACAAAGLVIRPQNLISDFTGQGQRATYASSQFAVVNTIGQNLFNYSTPNQFSGRGLGQPYLGRYGQ